MTKEELKQLRQVQLKIKVKQELLTEAKAQAYRITQMIKEVPNQKTNKRGGFEESVIKVMGLTGELEETIKNVINEYTELYKKATLEIEGMKDVQEQVILQMRYLACSSWEEIAKVTHLSKSRIYHIHGKALLSFEKKK